MRNILIIFLCTASVCLAQESCHNDEFGFTIDIPSGWYMTSENEWSDKVKKVLEKRYSSGNLLILNPSGIEPLRFPSIIVQGIKLKRTTTSEAIADLKNNGKERLTKHTGYMAKYDLLGKKINQYSKTDTFYNYDSSRKMAIAKILYEHNKEGTYVLVTMAKFIGRKRVVDFRGYWKGDDPEGFWQTFNEVIDSFEFDQDAKPGGIFGEAKEFSDMSKKQKFNLIWKWGGIILTISIIIGITRYVLGR